MARSLDRVLAELPAARRAKIERRAAELATLKDLRRAGRRTQADLAATLGVGQDTISRLERRGDMLLSTLRRYVEGIGGTLELVVRLPGRPPLLIGQPDAAQDEARSVARASPTRRTATKATAASDRKPR
jgi:transcriptional regulator with XRE-family HTH domain